MTGISDYSALVDRAYDALPEKTAEHERFQVPELDTLVEGNTTVIRNFADICDSVNREPEQVIAYLLRELGTAGNLDGKRAMLKGKATTTLIKERIKEYIDLYVLCRECGRPDTRIVKDGRTSLLECDACGAHRPLRVRKGGKTEEKVEDVIEGSTLEVMINDVGRKGDGIAKKGKYIIYVPGTTKGSIVKVKIEKVSGTVAFGKLVRE